MNGPDRWTRTRQLLLQPVGARKLLDEACASEGWRIHELVSVEPVKERPGRRLTVRCRVVASRHAEVPSEHTWYAKLDRSRRGARLHDRLRLLGAVLPPSVLLPESVGYSARRRLVVLASLPGRGLLSILRSEPGPAVARALSGLGCAMRALHDVHHDAPAVANDPVMVWSFHGPEQETALLSAAVDRIRESGLPSSLVAQYEGMAAWVQQRLRVAGDHASDDEAAGGGSQFQGSILHRDLHPGQIIVAGQGTGFLDLDEMARGEPELDLGNLLAHLILEDLQTGGRVARAPAWQEVVLTSYGPRPDGSGRLAVYQAASLLRLASLQRLAAPGLAVLDWSRLAERLVAAAAALQPGAEAERRSRARSADP